MTHIKPSPNFRKLGLSACFCVSVACLATLVQASGPIVVSQQGREFGVKRLEVPKGTVVRILNDDEFIHHAYIKSPDLKFDSGEIERGQYADIELSSDGTFTVRCAIHLKMRLDIVVK